MIPTAIQMTDENGPPVVGFFYGAELEAKNKLLQLHAAVYRSLARYKRVLHSYAWWAILDLDWSKLVHLLWNKSNKLFLCYR
jgi:hypothetical protein